MSSNCEDSNNQQYQTYWFNYFTSIGYIDNSDIVNLYVPYGKCTRKSLWITYLINIVHFFVLSTGVLYLLSIHRNQTGLWWPFTTWTSSVLFTLAAVACYILLDKNIKGFSILIIIFQIAGLIILSISIVAIIYSFFIRKHRYQQFLLILIIILLFIQLGCFIGQFLITLHCLYNLKFVYMSLDYSYLSAIFAAASATISTVLMDYMFMWYFKKEEPPRVAPTSINQQNTTVDRTASPVDSVILDYFRQESIVPSYRVYSNTDGTRHFHILPTLVANSRSTEKQLNDAQSKNVHKKRKIHPLITESNA